MEGGGGGGPPVFELPVLAMRPGTQLHTCAVECKAGCCQYFSLPIDTPRDAEGYDSIRWYLMHEDTHVYKDDGVWFLLVQRRCRHLQPDKTCGIYDRRPSVCADYDPSACEYTGEVDYELYFRSDGEMEEWLSERTARRRDAARRGWAKRKARQDAGRPCIRSGLG